jgi:DNA-binding CsgD family transcriptional regulator
LDFSEAEYLASLGVIQEAALQSAAWDKALRQLARLTIQLESMRRRHSAMEATLRRIAVAVLLLDRYARVVFANAAGEELLASGTALTNVRGTLAAQASRSDRQLQKAIQEVLERKLAAGAEVGIERERSRPLLATILYIAPANSFTPLPEDTACCAVFVSDPDCFRTSRSSAFACIYDLTPAETRLLNSILSGAGLAQAAKEMTISVTTARTHLTHIFSKTGTRRQGELINLVMNSTPPLWVR